MRVRPATAKDARGARPRLQGRRRRTALGGGAAAGHRRRDGERIRTALDEGHLLFALEGAARTAAPGPLIGLLDLRPTRIEGVHSIGMCRDGRLHSSVIMARLFPEATPPDRVRSQRQQL
ncbi:MAG TPA: hypothetical protein VGI17_06720 [Solirubrobacterales bacterium]|jgi:hypothetical protein